MWRAGTFVAWDTRKLDQLPEGTRVYFQQYSQENMPVIEQQSPYILCTNYCVSNFTYIGRVEVVSTLEGRSDSSCVLMC